MDGYGGLAVVQNGCVWNTPWHISTDGVHYWG